jgi:hypothetical protein
MDKIDRHEVLQGLFGGIVSIFVPYRLSYSTAVVPELKLWRLFWLVSVLSVGDLLS